METLLSMAELDPTTQIEPIMKVLHFSTEGQTGMDWIIKSEISRLGRMTVRQRVESAKDRMLHSRRTGIVEWARTLDAEEWTRLKAVFRRIVSATTALVIVVPSLLLLTANSSSALFAHSQRWGICVPP